MPNCQARLITMLRSMIVMLGLTANLLRAAFAVCVSQNKVLVGFSRPKASVLY